MESEVYNIWLLLLLLLLLLQSQSLHTHTHRQTHTYSLSLPLSCFLRLERFFLSFFSISLLSSLFPSFRVDGILACVET
jgi:hypothetical protein